MPFILITIGATLFYIGAVLRDNRRYFFVDFGSMPQENVSFQQLFEQALSSQQQKNWDVALDLYQQALDKGQSQITKQQTSIIYHNMSSVAFEKADFLKAYIWSKKSLALNPHNQLAQDAFAQYLKKFDPPKVAHQISTYENLQNMTQIASVDVWTLLSIFLVAASLRLFLKSIFENKKNLINQVEKKSFSFLTLAITILSLISIGFTALSWSRENTNYGLILTDKSPIQTAPGENKPVIYESQAGVEVEVLQFEADYIQVSYPGAFSGWVSKKNIELLF